MAHAKVTESTRPGAHGHLGSGVGALTVDWTGTSGSATREVTASTMLLRRAEDGWQVGLVWHERLQCHVPAGGHLEAGEGVEGAARREVWEETGLTARLIPGPAAPLPDGFPHLPVPAAWWITEGQAGADGHTRTRHVHLDHIYLALVGTAPRTLGHIPDHQLNWFSRTRLETDPSVSPDSRLLALHVLAWLCGAPAAAEDDPGLLAVHLAERAKQQHHQPREDRAHPACDA